MNSITTSVAASSGVIFSLFILCCAFSAQYWAYRCFQELKRMNDRNEQIPRA